MSRLFILNMIMSFVISFLSYELFVNVPTAGNRFYRICCATVFALILFVLVKKVAGI